MAALSCRTKFHSSLKTKTKKRRRRLKTLRLLHGKVEVRSKEEGFLGSWHKGTVISRKGMFFVAKFEVKYDHLLVDDSSHDHVVEIVNVSLVVFKKKSCGSTRGYIRPLPPLIELNKWGLPFGLCVDVSYNEGWWEGVIFDYEDGSEERNVFFPDLGDEMVVLVTELRITQDWDEVSEKWSRRGTWLFLEVVEEYVEKSGHQIPVSIKQLWYDLQGKEGVKDWTCSSRAVWEGLVLETIRGNLQLVLDHLFDEARLPNSEEMLLEIAKSVNLCSEDTHSEVPVEEEQSAPLASNDSSYTSLHESNSRCEAKEESMLPRPLHLTNCSSEGLETSAETPQDQCLLNCNGTPISSHSSRKAAFSNGSNRFNQNRRYALLPAEAEIVHEAKCCPEAVVQYAQAGAGRGLAREAKQHLLFLEWSIKFYKDPIGKTRKRYISPSGKCYDSLPNACRGLINSEGKNPPLVSEHEQTILHDEARCSSVSNLLEQPRDVHGTPPHSNHASYGSRISTKRPLVVANSSPEGSETSNETPQSKCQIKRNGLPVISPLSSKAAVSTGSTRFNKNRRYALLPAGPDIVDGAKCCPEAIAKFARGVTGRDVATAVKQHLLYLGWSIKFYMDASRVKRIRFISPSGKCYDSLPNVCRDLVKSDGKYPHLVTEHDEQTILHDEAPCDQPRDDHDTPPHSLQARSGSRGFMKQPNCLKAIMDCYKVSRGEGGKKNSRVRKTAKYHLAAMGWTVNIIIHNGKQQRMYKSPRGRSYRSLRKACKSCMDERDKSLASETDGRLSKSNRWIRGGQKERSRKMKIFHGSLRHRTEAELDAPNKSTHNNSITVLSWLLDNNAISSSAKAYYRTSKDDSLVAKEGKVTREGIKCRCCRKVFSLSSFELHAGTKYSRNCHGPASRIFLADGRSLLDCQVQVMRGKMRKLASKTKRLKVRHGGENDDVCSFCRSGGDLILCDQCPSSFHGSCLGMKDVPRGDWFCPSCCCRICNQNKALKECESSVDEGIHKYHIACLRNNGVDNLDLDHGVSWFCGKNCKQIYANLAALVGLPIPVGVDDLTWTLLKSVEYDDKESSVSSIEAAEAQSYMKLEIALHVMHECFEPLEEFRTGRDIVNDVIFSRRSELRRLDFRGFYTVLLEKDDEVVSVATLRIFGETAAEVPLVATRHKYRRLGMCRILMNVLEKKLTELGVERLVLPAAPTVLNTWTGSFGFSKMTDSERLQFADSFFLNFPGAILCHKLLSTCTNSSPLLKEIPQKTSQNAEEMELDGSSSLGSEVVQADETEQQHWKIGDNISSANATPVHPNPPRSLEISSSVDVNSKEGTKAKTDNSSIGIMKGTNGGCGLLKYYRRRKISRMKI
ncbi:Increased DNA methylation 1 [Linum perenne]